MIPWAEFIDFARGLGVKRFLLAGESYYVTGEGEWGCVSIARANLHPLEPWIMSGLTYPNSYI
jgi:hypothetical protein